MKLMAIILIFTVFQAVGSVYSQNTTFNFHLKNVPIKSVLQEIENTSEFKFLYRTEFLDVNRKVNIEANDDRVETILQNIFNSPDITYRVFEDNLIVITNNRMMERQQRIISGKVTDAATGEPIPGVNVVIKGTTIGTITSLTGEYNIEVSAPDAILVFSSIGYVMTEISSVDRNIIDVALEIELQALEEVVVVGYGEMSRAKITTSISKLDSKVLAHSARSNVGSALQGTISGLRVINTTGQPGSLPSILLRGGASINSPGSPLVVVDGVVRTLNDVNQSNIESIEVLKDAASTAIYGARANNGVILITTKKAKAGVSNVTYSLKAGINFRREAYNYVNAQDYIYYNRLGMKRANDAKAQGGVPLVSPDIQFGYGFTRPLIFDIARIDNTNRSDFQSLLGEGWQWMLDPYSDNKDTIVFKDYGHQVSDGVFTATPITQDHNLSFTGGNDKGRFATTLGYYNEDGIVIGTKYERFFWTFNGSYKIRKNLEITADASLSDSKTPADLPYDAFFRAQSLQPTFKPLDANGIPNSGTHEAYGNPLYYYERYVRNNDTRRSIFSFGANWEILPDLFLRGKSNIYFTDYTYESFRKKFVYQTGSVNISRPTSARYNKNYQQQHNILLDYRKSFNKQNVSIMVGGEYFDEFYFSLYAEGKSAPTDEIPTLNSAVERTSISSDRTNYRMMSGFSRLNYDYDGKYLLTAVIRYDGTSILGDNKWGAFPGISAGWNIHKEDFFMSSSLNTFISVLKPRISYGVNGNISGIGYYETQGIYGIQTFYNGQAGYLNTGLVNRGLRWEKSKMVDAGMDIGLLNNRATLNLTYFRRTTVDLLTNLALPGYTGFDSFRTNLGNLLNSGFESEISFKIIEMENGLNWDFGFNASYVKNKILKLPYNGNENNRQGGELVFDPEAGKVVWKGGYQEGGTIGDLYAYKFERVLRDWNDVNQTIPNRYDAINNSYGPSIYAGISNKLGKFPIEPGDALWADLDKNDTIDTRDRVYAGNIYPKWTGGFSSTISYKNFSLYGRFDFGFGHTIYNALLTSIIGQGVGHLNVTDHIYDTWTPDNQDAELPAFVYADQQVKMNYIRGAGSTLFYERGDYLALRELTLSYLLTQSILSKIKISSMQIYITGQNLAYFTKYSGTNPELGGTDMGRYPLPKTCILGLQVSF